MIVTAVCIYSASFDQAVPPYQKALDESGYSYTLNYEPNALTKRKKTQRNNILCYNPPFSKNVGTNIGHRFLALVDNHFPRDHKLRKIFNRNTIKISTADTSSLRLLSVDNSGRQMIRNLRQRLHLLLPML